MALDARTPYTYSYPYLTRERGVQVEMDLTRRRGDAEPRPGDHAKPRRERALSCLGVSPRKKFGPREVRRRKLRASLAVALTGAVLEGNAT